MKEITPHLGHLFRQERRPRRTMPLGELAVHTVQNPVLVNEVVSEAHVRVAWACVPKKSEEKKKVVEVVYRDTCAAG